MTRKTDELSNIAQAQAETKAGALFVVNHSGGKDSQAMLIKVLEVAPAAQILVIHATLGESEWPGALEHAQQQAEAAGVPFIVAKAGKSFLEMVERRFERRPEVPSWPGASTRSCTSDLKRGPISREIRRYASARGITRIVNCMGMRAAESPGRARKPAWTLNETQTLAARTKYVNREILPGVVVQLKEEKPARRIWHDWLPIHTLSTADVIATVHEAGQQLHPAYALGNERLSCVFCLLASASDLRHGAQRNPELYARYAEMERRTGYTLHMSRKTLPEITGIPA